MTEHVRAGWYPDPRGRAEYRYWNGGAWTDHVSTGGDQYLDTLRPSAPDVVVPAWPTPHAAARRLMPRTPLDVILDVAAVAGLVLLLVFPALAVASVPSAPRLRDAAVDLPVLQRSPAGDPLRSLPVFIKDGTAENAVTGGGLLNDRTAIGNALDEQSIAVFGSRGDGGPAALVVDQNNRVNQSVDIEVEKIPYPFHFAVVDAVLDRTFGSGSLSSDQVGPVNDLAGLLVLANASFPDAFPNGASVAFALYDRARESDQCEPQLNLAFLLSTDTNPRDDDTVTEFERAAKDCPNDPTPLWLLGEFQSGRASRNAFAGQQLDPSERERRPIATFQKLQQEFPGSALGWAGEADTLMRFGYEIDVAQPFTARKDFRRAKALYQRGFELDGDAGLAVGEARADAGLGDFDAAISAQRRAVDKARDSTPVQVRLVDYLERAHQFGEAADTNGGFLNATPNLPEGTQLIAAGSRPPTGLLRRRRPTDLDRHRSVQGRHARGRPRTRRRRRRGIGLLVHPDVPPGVRRHRHRTLVPGLVAHARPRGRRARRRGPSRLPRDLHGSAARGAEQHVRGRRRHVAGGGDVRDRRRRRRGARVQAPVHPRQPRERPEPHAGGDLRCRPEPLAVRRQLRQGERDDQAVVRRGAQRPARTGSHRRDRVPPEGLRSRGRRILKCG